MNWEDEQKRMETAMNELRTAFQGLVQENHKLRTMNAELYDHASDDMELEQLRKMNKQLFTLAGMPSEVGFTDEKKVER